jgi:beta-lactamase superfamily II metal-dependent hydrolase
MKSNLRIYVFNVGHGDHILIELPNGKYGIIDFCYQLSLIQLFPPSIYYFEYLMQSKKNIVIEFICISHPDIDHIKGLEIFLNWADDNKIVIEKFLIFAGKDIRFLINSLKDRYNDALIKTLINNSRKTIDGYLDKYSNNLRSLTNYLKKWNYNTGRREEYLQDIRMIYQDAENNFKLVNFAPLGFIVQDYNSNSWDKFFDRILYRIVATHTDSNLISSIINIIYESKKIIFGGDAGSKIWEKSIDHYLKNNFCNEYGSLESCFILASHHGSKHSSSNIIWQNILHTKKSVVAFSSGNAYNHPNHETINHIKTIKKKHKLVVDILSTNSTNNKILKSNFSKITLDWYPYNQSSINLDRITSSMLRTNSRSKKITNPDHSILGAYIIDIAKNDSEPNISIGLRNK